MYKGQLVKTMGFGHKDALDSSSPAPDASTLFRIGSMTKVFTTVNTLHDYYLGCFPSLDTPMSYLLPNFSLVSQFAESTPVTFRDAMGQSAGIPRLPACQSDLHCDMPTDEMLSLLKDFGTLYSAGFRASYSNMAFGLLGHASERCFGAARAGQSYESIVAGNVFQPWGLTNTGFNATVPSVVSRMAVGFTTSPYAGGPGPAPLSSFGWLNPSHGAYSNINDILHLGDLLMRGLSFEDQLTTASSPSDGFDGVLNLYLRRMFFSPSFVFPDSSSYGHPAEIYVLDNGLRLSSKSGSVYGYESMLAMQPDMDLSIALLANADGSALEELLPKVGNIIVSGFTNAILQQPYPFPVPPSGSVRSAAAAVGNYWFGNRGSVQVQMKPSGTLNVSIHFGSTFITADLAYVRTSTFTYAPIGSQPIAGDFYRMVNVDTGLGPSTNCLGQMAGYSMSELTFFACDNDASKLCSVSHMSMAYGMILDRDDSKQPAVPPSPAPPAPLSPTSCPTVTVFQNSKTTDDCTDRPTLVGLLAFFVIWAVISSILAIVLVRKLRKLSVTRSNDKSMDVLLEGEYIRS
jgi:CubicO group peptidase (beta-lactamase class C family)